MSNIIVVFSEIVLFASLVSVVVLLFLDIVIVRLFKPKWYKSFKKHIDEILHGNKDLFNVLIKISVALVGIEYIAKNINLVIRNY